MGSSALSLASVGAGRAAGVVLGGFDPIDVGAGVLIAAKAALSSVQAALRARCFGPLATRTSRWAIMFCLRPHPGLVDELVDIVELAMAGR